MPRRLALAALLLATAAIAGPTPVGSTNAKPLDDAAYDATLDDATAALIRQKRFFTAADLARAALTRTLPVAPPAPSPRVKSPAELFRDTARATLILSIRRENESDSSGAEPAEDGRTLASARKSKLRRGHRRRASAGNEATAFLAHESGIVVTCLHALPDDKSNFVISACTVNGRVVAVRDILLTDAETDIAILKVDPADDLGALALASDVPAGEPIRVLGHPWFRYFHMSDGIVARHSRTEPDDENPDAPRAPRIDITADIAEGSSGAPVVDAHGTVVGMAHSYVVETNDDGASVFKHRTAIPSAAILGKLRREE